MKKNTPFLLIVLLSVSAFSHSMDEKKKLEPQAIAAAAGAGAGAAASAGAAQPKNTSTIAELLDLATTCLATTQLPPNVPVSKAQLIEVVEQGKVALNDLDNHNEFTKTYIKDTNAFVASLIALRPQAESLFNRSVQFITHSKEVPSAVNFAQKLETAIDQWKGFKEAQDNHPATQEKRHREIMSLLREKHAEEISFLRDLLKQQTESLNMCLSRAKDDAKSAAK